MEPRDDITARIVAPLGAPIDVEALPGGTVNRTLRVRLDSGVVVVVRTPLDPLRADEFPVEAWLSASAGRVGIPVARVLRTGSIDGLPFLVTAYVPPAAEPVGRPFTWLGRYARTIGALPTAGAPATLFTRFGRDLAAAWAAHLSYNLAALGDDDPIRALGAYADASLLRDRFAALAARPFSFGPAHGDLAARNLVSRGADEPPVLLDWGAATTGPAPWTDAVPVFMAAFLDSSITPAAFEEFAAAAGIDAHRDRSVLEGMTALRLVDTVRWAVDHRPDLIADLVLTCRKGLASLGLDPDGLTDRRRTRSAQRDGRAIG